MFNYINITNPSVLFVRMDFAIPETQSDFYDKKILIPLFRYFARNVIIYLVMNFLGMVQMEVQGFEYYQIHWSLLLNESDTKIGGMDIYIFSISQMIVIDNSSFSAKCYSTIKREIFAQFTNLKFRGI